jgi:hypothetical protein
MAVPYSPEMVDIGGDNSRAPGRAARDRGQSETLGAVLVVAILISGATLVVAIGVMGISDTEDQLADSRAEKGMTQFSSKAGLVALEESDSQQVDFATDQNEQFRVDNTTGRMIISWENQTTGYNETVMDIDLGAFIYDGQNTELAYQGGGVFRASSGGGVMISPPEFHFRDGTLTLPAVNVTGDAGIGGRATVTRSNVVRKFPTGIDNSTNPLDDHVVTVTVQSEYYRGWGEYFEERTDGEVEYDPANETATLLMVTPIEMTEINSVSSSLSASGAFSVNGAPTSRVSGADNDIYSDSYNSTDGTYRDQFVSNDTEAGGDIVYAGQVDISGGAGGGVFKGELRSGDSVTVGSGSGKPDVDGDIVYTTNCNPSVPDCENRTVDPVDEVRKIDGIETASSVDWYVNNSVEEIADEADPSQTDPATDGELKSGDYHFTSDLVVNNSDELELNTTNGNIDIGVEENILVEDNAEINVTGDGVVRMYVAGRDTGPSGNHFYMGDNTTVGNQQDDAKQLRVYGQRDFTMLMDAPNSGSKTAKFVGVLYAPPGQSGTGSVTLDTGEIYGGILTGTTIIEGGSLHYDETLKNKQIIPPDANQVEVTFLHVTINQIMVEG